METQQRKRQSMVGLCCRAAVTVCSKRMKRHKVVEGSQFRKPPCDAPGGHADASLAAVKSRLRRSAALPLPSLAGAFLRLPQEKELVHPARVERATVRLEGGCSIQLSYGCFQLMTNHMCDAVKTDLAHFHHWLSILVADLCHATPHPTLPRPRIGRSRRTQAWSSTYQPGVTMPASDLRASSCGDHSRPRFFPLPSSAWAI